MLRKKSTQLISIILLGSLLFGCAMTHLGEGIVVEKQLYNAASEKNLDEIKNNTLHGMKNGAIGGAAVGGAYGRLGSAIAYNASAPLWTLIFAIPGGFIGGATGIAVGSGVGLIKYALKPSHKATWQYKVKSLNGPETFIIKEQSTNIILHTQVKVMERNGLTFIKNIPRTNRGR